MNRKLLFAWALLLALFRSLIQAQEKPPEQETGGLHVNLASNIDRPLRYTPIGTDFVITNGTEFFNRPLYGNNTAFRVDAGDKPEFSLYLPGRGGNLRLGIKTEKGVKWLNDVDRVVAHYHPGSMVYEIKDASLMETRELRVTVLPLSGTKGFIVSAAMNSAWMPIELVWAYGGANGMKGRRNGDIGCEREPVSKFFQLEPEQCTNSDFTITANTFTLKTKSATISGVASIGAQLALGDANLWNSPDKLFVEREPGATDPTPLSPLLVGHIPLPPAQSVYLAFQQVVDDMVTLRTEELPEAFTVAEERRRAIAERVSVETPDPYINAAAAALNVAADGVWDEAQQSFMHGAVAWRNRLLGWRGQYAGDALGWHERTAAHIAGFAKQQNTGSIPEQLPPADDDANLSRSENALHSNGNLGKNHYDMNLVAMDALFRHLLWTGDRQFAVRLWPVLERHLAWERRLFRREFGPEKLPLYEAYACIWASDDLA